MGFPKDLGSRIVNDTPTESYIYLTVSRFYVHIVISKGKSYFPEANHTAQRRILLLKDESYCSKASQLPESESYCPKANTYCPKVNHTT